MCSRGENEDPQGCGSAKRAMSDLSRSLSTFDAGRQSFVKELEPHGSLFAR